MGRKADRVQNALLRSTQLGPILASGTEGDRRQIKRLPKTLLLLQSSAYARGFGDDVKLPVLAKLILAESFFRLFFYQIATSVASDANGISTDLFELEEEVIGE